MKHIAPLMFLALAAVIPAQAGEATAYIGLAQITGGRLGTFGPESRPVQLDNGYRAGFRVMVGEGFTGHEVTYGYERHDLKIAGGDSSRANVQQVAYDYVVHVLPKVSPVRPFVLAGIGVSRFSPGNEGAFGGADPESKFAYNYGGGLKFKVAPFIGLRVDIRDYVTGKPKFLDLTGVDGKMHNVEYSAGLSLRF